MSTPPPTPTPTPTPLPTPPNAPIPRDPPGGRGARVAFDVRGAHEAHGVYDTHDARPTRAERELAPARAWQRAIYVVVFRNDTRAGRAFDIALMVVIGLSIAVALAESVESTRARYGRALLVAEWTFTLLFTVEYVVRLLCVRRPLKYATSFFGVVDLLTVLPTYLSAFIVGSQSLIVIRALRLLRVFRVLRLPQYLSEADYLSDALRAARRKIVVFVFTVLMIVLIVGALMYLIEGPAHGFTSIPTSIYWAIVTLTTVGYGDLAPATTLGRTVASAVMILGYGIIAVPTGIVTAELVSAVNRPGQRVRGRVCRRCGRSGHDEDARYCNRCAEALDES